VKSRMGGVCCADSGFVSPPGSLRLLLRLTKKSGGDIYGCENAYSNSEEGL